MKYTTQLVRSMTQTFGRTMYLLPFFTLFAIVALSAWLPMASMNAVDPTRTNVKGLSSRVDKIFDVNKFESESIVGILTLSLVMFRPRRLDELRLGM